MADRTTVLTRSAQAPLVLGWLVLVHFVASWIWIDADAFEIQLVQDQGTHVSSLVHLITNLEIGGPEAVLRSLREFHHFYPSVAFLPLALPAVVLEPSPTVYRLANVFYFVLFLTAVYMIGRKCHGKRAGLLAAALGSLMPAVFGGWRTVGLDYPLAAITPWAIYFLLRSRGLRSPGPATLFGALSGVAVLVKGQGLFFLLGPAAFVLFAGLWRSWRDADRPALLARLRGGALAVLATAAVSSIWWWGRLGYLVGKLTDHMAGKGVHEYDMVALWDRPLFIARALPSLFSASIVLALIILLPRVVRRCRRGQVLAVWLVVPLVLFFGLGLRQWRYLLPLAPVVAVLVGCGLASLGPRLRGVATLATALAAMAAWISGSYTTAPADPGGWHTVAAVLQGRSVLNHQPRPAVVGRDNPITRALAGYLQGRRPGGQGVYLFTADHQELMTLATSVQRRLPGLRLLFHGFPSGDRLYMFRLKKGHQRYLLIQEPELEFRQPPALHRRVLRVPCSRSAEVGIRLQCQTVSLYRLDAKKRWPTWLTRPDPRGLSRFLWE